MQIKTLVLQFLNKYQEVQAMISGLFLTLLALVVTIQVIARYILDISVLGLSEFMVPLMIWLYMLGGANASAKDSHVECGLVKLALKNPKKLAMFNLLRRIFVLVINLKLLQMTYAFFEYSLKVKKYSSVLKLSVSASQIAIFVGLCLMFIFGLRSLYMDFQNYKKLSSNKDDGGGT